VLCAALCVTLSCLGGERKKERERKTKPLLFCSERVRIPPGHFCPPEPAWEGRLGGRTPAKCQNRRDGSFNGRKSPPIRVRVRVEVKIKIKVSVVVELGFGLGSVSV
jgi:hypothetical protein